MGKNPYSKKHKKLAKWLHSPEWKTFVKLLATGQLNGGFYYAAVGEDWVQAPEARDAMFQIRTWHLLREPFLVRIPTPGEEYLLINQLMDKYVKVLDVLGESK